MSRAAVLITGLTAVSTLMGLARDIVIAGVFGAGPDLDAYLVAQGLMNIVLGLAAGAMARSVTPVAAREAAAEEPGCHGHRSFDVAITMTMVVLGIAGVLMSIFAAPVTAVLAPGFEGEQARVAEDLTRIVLVATVLIGGTNLLASLSQAHGKFVWSSLQGVPFNIVMIVAAGIFGPRYGVSALAVGFVVGSGLRMLLQFPPLRALGTRIRPSFALRDPGFREIARMVPALLVGSAIGNVNTLVDRAVGSTLADGSITALSYGWRLVSLPQTLLITSLLVALYPALGASADRRDEVRRLVGRGLTVTVTLLTPICVVFAVAAAPLVSTAFGYGAFDENDTRATAIAVLWYAPALLALGCREVILRASYAIGDTKAPVTVAVAAMAVNVVGDIALGPIYGISGIAFATTASLVLAAVLNGWALHRRHGGLAARPVLAMLGRAAVLAVTSTAAGLGASAGMERLDLAPILEVGVLGAVICGVYIGGLVLLRAPERFLVVETLHAIRRRRR